MACPMLLLILSAASAQVVCPLGTQATHEARTKAVGQIADIEIETYSELYRNTVATMSFFPVDG